MPGADAPSRPVGPEPAGRLRIQATTGRRRVATALQWALIAAILGLAWSGARVLGLFWDQAADPEAGRLLWLFTGLLVLALLTLAWLVVLIQDLAKVVLELDDRGITVDRLLQPFTAGWGDVVEVGIAARLGHLTLRSRRGSVTTTARLLGAGPFAALVAALRDRVGPRVREWTPWAATRRQLLLLIVPIVGALLIGLIAQGLLRRRRSWAPPR